MREVPVKGSDSPMLIDDEDYDRRSLRRRIDFYRAANTRRGGRAVRGRAQDHLLPRSPFP